jgi:hypothetical protein
MDNSSYFDCQLGGGRLTLYGKDLNCKDFERILRKLSVKWGREQRPRKCRKLDGLNYILSKLPPPVPVTELDFYSNSRIGNGGMSHLHLVPETVTELWLSRCGLTSEGIKILCEYLKTNTSIEKLCMGQNEIGDKGTKYIAEMLRVNKTLQELRLHGTMIGPEGFGSLGDLLRVNSTLRKLDLSGNPGIRDGQYRNLFEGLRVNRGVEFLGLYGRSVPGVTHYEGTEHIIDCLRSNHYMTTIFPAGPFNWGLAWSEMSFFLELNKLNRKIRHDEEATLSDWLDCVIQASNKHEDVSYSYYFLRNKPELCMYAHNVGA